MNTALTQKLTDALSNKKLNQTAHDQIVTWLTDEEYAECQTTLTERVVADDWDTLMDQFYRTQSFGTGGMRSTMDIGTNRLNGPTIRWVSQGFAQYLLKHHAEVAPKGVAIAYDSRHHSQEFMQETARVIAANGLPVYIFDGCRATPELSFVVRHLGLAGGIVITASHNPPQFNGWKVYDHFGVQMLPGQGALIEAELKSSTKTKKLPFDQAVSQNLIRYIPKLVDELFLASARQITIYPGRSIKIVYSPLHGVGTQNVLPALLEAGFSDIVPVEQQMSLDGSFPTVKDHFPQPEFPVVYEPSIELAKQVKADLILVSDPDADRLGMAVPTGSGEWQSLSGNQGAVVMGAFYLEQLKAQSKMPSHPVIIKTTVTTELVRDIGEKYGVEVIGDLLVGFKYIGDRLEHLPADKQFLFGAEESIGYLFTTEYRDKGAETPAVVAAEMTAWLKDQGKHPLQFLEEIYQEYGYYAERLYYKLMEGLGALDQMNIAMSKLRQDLPKELAGQKIVKYLDRLTGEVRDGQTGALLETRTWDQGDMLSFFLTVDERTAVHVRPSGTEPKMKYYTMVKGRLQDTTKDQLNQEAIKLEVAIVKIFEDILATVKVDVF
jgi:phosphoglucomutase